MDDSFLFDELLKNDLLKEFCIKVIGIGRVLKHEEFRYMCLGSLVSSDNLCDESSCLQSLDTLVFIKDNIKLFGLCDKIEKDVIEYVNDGIEIVKSHLNIIKGIKNKEACWLL